MASVRRVRRIVRKIDPWTVLKVSFVFYAIMALGIVLGLVIFWSFVKQAGYPDTVESLLADLGLWSAGESPTVPRRRLPLPSGGISRGGVGGDDDRPHDGSLR